jgi:hypothetical protein
MILAMLTQFHRKDMVTMTVCTLGFYLLSFPDKVRRSQFRMLVLLIGVAICQDVFWFILNRDAEDDEDDGGVERGVKGFARNMSYISFAWRVSRVLNLLTLSCFYDLDFTWHCALERLLRLRVDC